MLASDWLPGAEWPQLSPVSPLPDSGSGASPGVIRALGATHGHRRRGHMCRGAHNLDAWGLSFLNNVAQWHTSLQLTETSINTYVCWEMKGRISENCPSPLRRAWEWVSPNYLSEFLVSSQRPVRERESQENTVRVTIMSRGWECHEIVENNIWCHMWSLWGRSFSESGLE